MSIARRMQQAAAGVSSGGDAAEYIGGASANGASTLDMTVAGQSLTDRIIFATSDDNALHTQTSSGASGMTSGWPDSETNVFFTSAAGTRLVNETTPTLNTNVVVDAFCSVTLRNMGAPPSTPTASTTGEAVSAFSLPSMTVATAGSTAIIIAMLDDDDSTISTVPTGYTLAVQNGRLGSSMAILYQLNVAAGSTGVASGEWSSADNQYVIGYIIPPPTPADSWTDPDLTNASYDSVSFSVSGQEASPRGMAFSEDGTKMYVIGETGDDVNEYDLSTAWVVSSASFLQAFSVATQENRPTSIFFKPDGNKMYVLGRTGDDVNEYDLSTAWDISTSVYLQAFSVSTQDATPWGLFFNSDGSKMYVAGIDSTTIYEYTLSTGWDVSSASYVHGFSVSSQEANPYEVNFNPDGDKMYIVGSGSDAVFEYDLSTAGNVSTAVYNSVSFSVASQETSPYSFRFKSDGSKLYVIGFGTTVYQYSTA
jgi:6-phosphogluconolactonase (cycloisomerase 2 family)